MHPALRRTEHRPWPLPAGRWTWRQTWRDLLFAHWPVPAAVLRPLIPPRLTVEELDGTAWLGVVPFRMTGVARRPLPDLPWISAFPELNVRTYVERGGKPGVWFFSLDAGNPLAVWAARRFFHLPYFRARMSVERGDRRIRYESVRLVRPGEAAGSPDDPAAGPSFVARYGPTSEPYQAGAGTLEHRLTERYCLYASSADGRLFRTEVHHRPWPLQSATAEIQRNELCEPHGLACEGPPALLHFCRRLDVVVWPPEELGP